MPATYFSPELFRFLADLKANNERSWFEAHRDRYEQHLKGPALRFIEDFAPHLQKVSPHFRADPRPVGGSLFRIHRDVRFSKDKSPYKTHVGIHFRHEQARTAHAPGFYLHLEPGQVFLGAGIWRPERPALERIRERLGEEPRVWKRVRDGKRFRDRFDLSGESLSRVPRGYAADHPVVDDLRRKDFIAVAPLEVETACGPGLLKELGALCRDAGPFVRFLCEALEVAF
ncbi:MAG: DUF2461 domain-containing protein [Gemmatimonadota bacterium]